MTQGTTVLRIYLFIGESQTLLMYVTGVFCYCTLWVCLHYLCLFMNVLVCLNMTREWVRWFCINTCRQCMYAYSEWTYTNSL